MLVWHYASGAPPDIFHARPLGCDIVYDDGAKSVVYSIRPGFNQPLVAFAPRAKLDASMTP
jgi:hypothetical protein